MDNVFDKYDLIHVPPIRSEKMLACFHIHIQLLIITLVHFRNLEITYTYLWHCVL